MLICSNVYQNPNSIHHHEQKIVLGSKTRKNSPHHEQVAKFLVT